VPCITGRRKRAVSEELKERGKEVGLNIRVEKNRTMVQNRRKGGKSQILTIKRS